jgi:peptide deformylase
VAIRKILTLDTDAARLRQKSKRVPKGMQDLEKLIADMFETMEAAPGVGLAAPQIGIPIRLIVFSADEKRMALLDPEIVRASTEMVEEEEGCLSLPNYYGPVKRHVTVTVKARTPAGKEIRLKADGLLARVLQHEIDHLNGALFIDRMEDLGLLHRVEAEEQAAARR